ncbi:hypothetical protein AZE42_03644 [Rhizopogon vesiculosus]|uniref:Uncharacterized protein n=1 Tax=Rhizopogon vesiculosus TaxID=180088 RepID=A0A1J8QHP5_9AGAM|nr:hypothetical protein AZE42_03644 [Rhizopogon vesiculosus]
MQHSNLNIADIPSNSTSSAGTCSPSFDEVHMSDLGDALDRLEFSITAAGRSPCATSATIVNSDVQMGPAPNTNAPFNAAQQPPLDPSIFTSAPSSTASGKRKAIEDDDSTLTLVRPSHSTKSGDSEKSSHLSMLLAIQQMGSNLRDLNSTFERVTNAFEVNTSNTIARSVDPLRRQKAVLQLQNEGLEDHQILNVLNKFQSDIAIVDIYLAIEKDSLRKLFLDQHSK